MFSIFDRLHGGLSKKPEDRVDTDELFHCFLYYHQSLQIPDAVLLKLSSNAATRRCRKRSECLKLYALELQEGCDEIFAFLSGAEEKARKEETAEMKMARALEPEDEESVMNSLQHFKHFTATEIARLERIESGFR